MGSFNKDFENMTVAQLKKLTEEYQRCQEIIQKQDETIRLLKAKYPTKKTGDELDLDKLIQES